VKHIFPHHLIFQFICENTIEEQVLDNVSVQLEKISDHCDLLRNESVIILPRLISNTQGYTYVVFERPQVSTS
jgi:coatomer subunit gamma